VQLEPPHVERQNEQTLSINTTIFQYLQHQPHSSEEITQQVASCQIELETLPSGKVQLPVMSDSAAAVRAAR
jgi:hypothetical protein